MRSALTLLHRWFGLAIADFLISLMGLVVAILSVTGVVILARKRAARLAARRSNPRVGAASAQPA